MAPLGTTCTIWGGQNPCRRGLPRARQKVLYSLTIVGGITASPMPTAHFP